MKKVLLILCVLMIALPALAENAAWDMATATKIMFDGDSTVVDGSGVDIDGSVATITAAGDYVLSGTLNDGQLCIAATNQDLVRLILNGVTMSCSTSAPIYASQADEMIVVLAEGTVNTLSDAEAYVYPSEDVDEPDAALFSKDDLTITGTGTLIVQGNYRNGIGTKDDLVIESGVLNVTAVNDGLRGKDSVTVIGGDITIGAGNDGIKANNDTDVEKGWVRIEGGSFDIDAAFDGIQAETDLTVTGGDFNIVSGGGAANAPERAPEQGPGDRGGRGGWGEQQQTTAETVTETSDSMKGLKAGVSVTIEGGTFTIDSADDAFHSNGDMRIAGGTMTIATGDDAFHADGALTIDGGTFDISTCYEGLEGATVQVTGGDIRLTASDDGINAAGGTDSAGVGAFGQDTFRMGGSSDYWIEISGGTIWISADGDGIDSNGALTFSGGEVTVHGPASGGDSAIDADGTVTVNGGTIIAGGATGQLRMPGETSAQPTLAIYFANGFSQGDAVTLLDGAGNEIAAFTAEKGGQLIQFSMPDLALGDTYSFRVNEGDSVSVTLEAATTSIMSDGSAYSGGVGGFGGGGFGGGGGRRPENFTPPEGMEPPTQEAEPQATPPAGGNVNG